MATDKYLNKCELEDGICLISLYDRKGNVRDKAIVDADQYNNVILKKWHLTTYGYVVSSDNIYLHHFIIGKAPIGEEVDHKNMNKLDNRKQNLRFCIHMDNQINRGPLKNNKSGYKGVSWDKQHNKWQVGICRAGKRKHLGLFDSVIIAANAYDTAAKQLQNNEFIYLNSTGGV